MKHDIQCFVLFSAVVIVASVVALLLHFKGPHAMATATAIEGFQTAANTGKMTHAPVSAAGQSSLSSTAGSADGSSDHQHLLDQLLKKQDRLAEAFENRRSGSVTATTTKKNGIASVSADANADANADEDFGPSGQWSKLVGCSDKCTKIVSTANAVRGTCVNPPISETNRNPDYSKKYCLAFRPSLRSMREQECMTCGYYAYAADCLKKADPKNPDKCTKYGGYTYQAPTGANAKSYYECANDDNCKLFLEKGGGGGGGGGASDKSGPDCSKESCPAKEVTIAGVTTPTQKCVVPGCLSNSGGLPYPKDFYGNDMINPCKRTGNGYICPAVTFGSTESYNSVGGSDPCYITGGKPDILKFQSINKICNSVKPTSVQNFKPGTTDSSGASGASGRRDRRGRRASAGAGTSTSTSTSTSASRSSTNSDNVVNVYHHYISGRPRWSNTYNHPESGLIYLGIY